eukprot:5055130-Pyramimonas_sp.AAC.1
MIPPHRIYARTMYGRAHDHIHDVLLTCARSGIPRADVEFASKFYATVDAAPSLAVGVLLAVDNQTLPAGARAGTVHVVAS